MAKTHIPEHAASPSGFTAQEHRDFIKGLMKLGWTRDRASEAWSRLTDEPSSSRLLNYDEGAKLLGVARTTLEGWIASRKYGVPFIKVGRLVRFRPDSLKRWLESRARAGEQLTVTNEDLREQSSEAFKE